MKYAVNEAGVSALQKMAAALIDSSTNIFNKTSQLQALADEHGNDLGPHKASLNQAILEIYTELKASAEPVKELSSTLEDIAEGYQEIIGNNVIASASGSSAGASAGAGSAGGNEPGGNSSVGAAASEQVRACGREWTDSLPSENRAAIASYTSTAYENINATLRGLEHQFNPGNYERARKIHQSLSGASIPAVCTVYRGTSSKALGALRMLPDSLLVGKVISDRGFMSTSLEQSTAFDGEVLLEIDVPKGAHGAYVGDISALGHQENEVLFDMGQKMRITNVRRDADGRRIISVRILN